MQEPEAKRFRGKQGKQEGVGKGGDEEKLEAIVPGPKARGFHGEFRLGITPSHLNLPSTGISADEMPGLTRGKDRLVGE